MITPARQLCADYTLELQKNEAIWDNGFLTVAAFGILAFLSG
tara:strand:- start:62 stop:187 length:126 start_codon:yes stop_codon:yes gene_type:complete